MDAEGLPPGFSLARECGTATIPLRTADNNNFSAMLKRSCPAPWWARTDRFSCGNNHRHESTPNARRVWAKSLTLTRNMSRVTPFLFFILSLFLSSSTESTTAAPPDTLSPSQPQPPSQPAPTGHTSGLPPNSNAAPDAPSGPEPLTNASLCTLVLWLLFGTIFQAAPGSLLFGPTSVFWRASPISAAIETAAIALNLLAAVARGLGLPRPRWSWWDDYEFAEPPPPPLSVPGQHLRRLGWWRRFAGEVAGEALALTAVRVLSTEGRAIRERLRVQSRRRSVAERARLCEKLVVENTSLGVLSRMAIWLPLTAQYVKLMLVGGSVEAMVIPETLGTIYYAHWTVVMCMVLLARGAVGEGPPFVGEGEVRTAEDEQDGVSIWLHSHSHLRHT